MAASIAPFLSTLEGTAIGEPYNAGNTVENQYGGLVSSDPGAGPIPATPAAATTTSTPAPQNTPSTTDLTSGGGTTPDPAAVAAAAAAAAKATQIANAISFGITGINQAATTGIDKGSADLSTSGEQAYSNLDPLQNNIDLARQQIGTTQINTIKQLTNTIRNGLQGTGVQLGNSGALSSSAADAAARAYANYGNVQTNAANNTAATGNIAQDTAQNNLDVQIGASKTELDNAKQDAIDTIVGQAQQALTSLGTVISVYLQGDASQIPTQQIQSQIIQNAQDSLAQVDQNYQNMLNGIHPATAAQTAQAAEAASNAGVVPSAQTPYSVTPATTAPSTTTDGGAPAPSLIPLTVGKAQNDQTPGS